MITKDSIPSVHPECIWRKYLKGVVIEPGLALNETGALFFENCDGEKSIDQICRIIQTEYTVSYEECLQDLIEMCEDLEEQEILVFNKEGQIC